MQKILHLKQRSFAKISKEKDKNSRSITQSGVFLLFSFKSNKDDFGVVKESERESAVTESAADNHSGILAVVYSGGILWEKSLTGRKKRTDEREPPLTAVSMT